MGSDDEGRPDEYEAFEPVPACPLCSSTVRTTVDVDAAVVRCLDCGHRFVDPRPTQEEIARAYSRPDAYDGWLAVAQQRQVLWERRFRRALASMPPGRLLDVGAGLGTFLAIARDHGWKVEGTEVSSSAIRHAEERYGLVLREGRLEDVAPAGRQDAITLWHVIEHLPDPVGSLRYCRQLLAEHGRIILAMPNDGDAAWSLTAAGNVARRFLGRPPAVRYERLVPGVETHIQHFDGRTISHLLERCGFEVVTIGVDDASPHRSPLGRLAFAARRFLTAATPWNLGREMLVVGRVN
jgi:SAM-dependent methyltransferase